MKFGRLTASLVAGSVLCAAVVNQASSADAPVYKAAPALGPSSVLWLGAAFKDNVKAGFVGGMWAPNGSLDSEGWLFRGQFLYVDYTFDAPISPTGSADGRLSRGDAQVGYQVVRGGFATSLFLGVDYQNYNINPAAANADRLQSEAGLMVSGRIASVPSASIPFSIDANYSTANSSYWILGRTGVKLGTVTVGPEIGALGNKAFDEIRYGLYSSYTFAPGAILQLNAGYSDRTRGTNFTGGNGNGVYGGVTLVFLR
jgi:hypothetical protein